MGRHIAFSFGADLEYAGNTLGLPHHNSQQDMCSISWPTRPTCLTTASTKYPNWRSTIVDNNGYLARVREPRHALVAHELFNYHTYRFDLLRMCDHHGVCSHVIGNVL